LPSRVQELLPDPHLRARKSQMRASELHRQFHAQGSVRFVQYRFPRQAVDMHHEQRYRLHELRLQTFGQHLEAWNKPVALALPDLTISTDRREWTLTMRVQYRRKCD